MHSTMKNKLYYHPREENLKLSFICSDCGYIQKSYAVHKCDWGSKFICRRCSKHNNITFMVKCSHCGFEEEVPGVNVIDWGKYYICKECNQKNPFRI